MMTKGLAIAALGSLLIIAGCSSDNGKGADATPSEASVDATNNNDIEPDTAIDAAPDVSNDVAIDSAPDSELPDSTPPDQSPDVLPDAQPTCAHPQVTESCSAGWCTIPAGCFVMGSPTGEACRVDILEQQHEVTLTKSFEIEATEVTQLDFKTRRGYTPSGTAPCDNCPAVKVTWSEAAAYCNALSEAKGLTKCYSCGGSGAAVSCYVPAAYQGNAIYLCDGYRMPTEAEFEYAYRAGTTTGSYNGDISQCTGTDPVADAIGWYSGNSGGAVALVKGKAKNAWGLYDMAGNVWEWSHDWNESVLGSDPVTDPSPLSGTDRVVRGGSWSSAPANLRAADRGNVSSTPSSDDIGFRCLRRL
jgi:formylglycine-generating enzyme required for sulfatase activity